MSLTFRPIARLAKNFRKNVSKDLISKNYSI